MNMILMILDLEHFSNVQPFALLLTLIRVCLVIKCQLSIMINPLKLKLKKILRLKHNKHYGTKNLKVCYILICLLLVMLLNQDLLNSINRFLTSQKWDNNSLLPKTSKENNVDYPLILQINMLFQLMIMKLQIHIIAFSLKELQKEYGNYVQPLSLIHI